MIVLRGFKTADSALWHMTQSKRVVKTRCHRVLKAYLALTA